MDDDERKAMFANLRKRGVTYRIFDRVQEEISKVPDVDDPRKTNYWVRDGDYFIYIEGWSDYCLSGTGFPKMEQGGTQRKLYYMMDLTPGILKRKAQERNLKLLDGGFVETEDKSYLYGITWGLFKVKGPPTRG